MVSATLNSHRYYFCNERDYYIERLASVDVIDTDWLVRKYQPHWDELRSKLAPYIPEIETLD